MTRPFEENTLLIATGNQGKMREIAALFQGFPLEIVSTTSFALEEPEEHGSTFLENAVIKAEYYGKATGLPALADDSGLCVDALGGEPGIYSARLAKSGKDFPFAFGEIERRLAGQASTAYFICVLALRFPDGHMESFEGRVDGRLQFPPKGLHGHGYDPIFVPNGYDITFAEMTDLAKNQLSHRARAFESLLKGCFAMARKDHA